MFWFLVSTGLVLLAVTGALTMMTYLSYALSDHARGIFGVRATGFALLAPLVLVGVNTSESFTDPSGDLVIVHRNNRKIISVY